MRKLKIREVKEYSKTVFLTDAFTASTKSTVNRPAMERLKIKMIKVHATHGNLIVFELFSRINPKPENAQTTWRAAWITMKMNVVSEFVKLRVDSRELIEIFPSHSYQGPFFLHSSPEPKRIFF